MSLGYVKREIPVTRCVSRSGSQSTCEVKDAIEANESEDAPRSHSRLSLLMWRGVVGLVAFVLPFVIVGVSAVHVPLKGYDVVPGLLVLVVSCLNLPVAAQHAVDEPLCARTTA